MPTRHAPSVLPSNLVPISLGLSQPVKGGLALRASPFPLFSFAMSSSSSSFPRSSSVESHRAIVLSTTSSSARHPNQSEAGLSLRQTLTNLLAAVEDLFKRVKHLECRFDELQSFLGVDYVEASESESSPPKVAKASSASVPMLEDDETL